MSDIFKETIVTFIGVLLALFSAGIAWFMKSAYEKHKAETLALARLERMMAQNLTMLKDNFDFLKEWIDAVDKNKPYSCHFANYLVSEDETYKISNLDLINKVLSINYKLRRTNLDFDHLFRSYWDIIMRIENIADQNMKEQNLKTYHNTFIIALQKMSQNYKPLNSNIVDVVALIRAAHRVRKHSLFGYLSFLFKDIYPKINEKAIEKERANLLNNIKNKEKEHE